MTYRIREWSSIYENNRTRELKRMDWVPVPNRMDGDGYTELLDHPAGASHLGAWLALVQIASRCDPRGTLLRAGGKPHDFASLARISRISAEVFQDAVPRLISIGWIEIITVRAFKDLQEGAGKPQGDAALEPQDGAAECPRNGMEGNGTEGKKKRPTQPLDNFELHDWFEERMKLHPNKRDIVLAKTVLSEISAADEPEWRGEVARVHDLWRQTEMWRWKGGARCPTFASWLTDQGWKYEPPIEKSETETAMEQFL